MNNEVRIIGGEWKRTKLSFVEASGLRPTSDRMRDTLFNWLMWDVANSHVLDTCAGSGILGFEALSRGAHSCLMIEPNPQQYVYLKKHAQQLNCLDRLVINNSSAEQVLADYSGEKFDLVFLDPPYSFNLWQSLTKMILPHLHSNSLIYIEADRPHDSINLPAGLKQVKQSKVASIFGGLYQLMDDA